MKQKRTILFLVRLYHPHIGGVEKHVSEITNVLSKKGYDVTIVTEQYDKALPLNEKVGNANIFRVPIGKSEFLKKFYIWKWVLTHYNLFVHTEIIHTHDVFYWILPVRPFLLSKKIYTTFHGYEDYPVKMRRKMLRKISELLSNGSICVGDFMKKWYWSKPNIVIYGGVRGNTTTYVPNRLSAVFFGRLDDQTGISEYIEAYKAIKKKYPNFKLTVVGEGKFKYKIPKEVKVVPFVTDVDNFIIENRFIFVSRYLSMLEALLYEREVIAVYDNPIKKDYLQQSPFKKYVSIARNGHEIADFVIDSIKNTEANRYKIKSGKVWAKSNSWEKVVATYQSLWKI